MTPTGRRRTVAVVAATLAAALLVAALAALRLGGRATSGDPRRGDLVFAFEPARAVGVALEGSVRARLARAGGGWRAADGGPADGAAVEAALARLASLRRRATLGGAGTSREELGFYGLAAPRLRATVSLEGGAAPAWALGGTTGEDGAAFVLAPSGEVVVIAAEASAALERDLARLGDAPRPGEAVVPAGAAPAPPAGRR